MNHLTRDKASTLVSELGLPAFFIDVINEKVGDPIALHFACSPLYYLSAEEQKAYELGDVIPLWASYDGDINYVYDIKNDDFILFYLEDGKVERRYNWQQLIKEQVEAAMEYEFDSDVEASNAIEKIKIVFSGLKLNDLDELIKNVQESWETN